MDNPVVGTRLSVYVRSWRCWASAASAASARNGGGGAPGPCARGAPTCPAAHRAGRPRPARETRHCPRCPYCPRCHRCTRQPCTRHHSFIPISLSTLSCHVQPKIVNVSFEVTISTPCFTITLFHILSTYLISNAPDASVATFKYNGKKTQKHKNITLPSTKDPSNPVSGYRNLRAD